MKRIVVIGCPGSGKSTLSKKLHEITGYPLYHLDNLFWNKDGSHISREEFDRMLYSIFPTESWILDGDFSRTYKMRMDACDTVLFLDYPKELCLAGIEKRSASKRTDCPLNNVDDMLMREIDNYASSNRIKILELLKMYTDKDIHIFFDHSDAEYWLTKTKDLFL